MATATGDVPAGKAFGTAASDGSAWRSACYRTQDQGMWFGGPVPVSGLITGAVLALVVIAVVAWRTRERS